MRKQKFIQKMTRRASLFLLLVSFALAAAQPARAQWIVTDPLSDSIATNDFAKTIVQYAAEAAQWYHDNVQSSLAAATARIADWLRANLELKIVDIKSVNDRQNVNADGAQKLVADRAMPSSYSSCRVAQSASSRASSAASVASMTGILAQAGSKQPRNNVMKEAQDTAARLADGLTPCSTTGDTDNSAYAALSGGCPTPSWGSAFQGADTTWDDLFGSNAGVASGSPYEFPMPPNVSLKNGVYQPVPTVTDPKYMPFVAAYSYCQRIGAANSQLGQQIAGKVTSSAMQANGKNNTDAQMSSAYSLCMSLLAERIQYDSTNANYAHEYSVQKASCDADNKSGLMDDTDSTGGSGIISTYSKCVTSGRSDLQMMFDSAYADQYESYHGVYLTGVDRATVYSSNAELRRDRQGFKNYILAEKQALATAMAQSHSITPTAPSSALNMSTQ